MNEISVVGAGNPAPQNDDAFSDGSYPFFRTSDVGKILFGEIATSADLLNDAARAKLRLVPAGTVLMPKSGASTFLNHRVITAVEGYVSSHLATITPNTEYADGRYLLYALDRVRAQALLPENSYPSLNLNLIKGIKIPLPPLEEQRRIVAVLDEAFDGLARARENTEANLASARELFAGAMDEALSDPELNSRTMSLADIVTEDCTLSYGIVQPGDEIEEGLPTVRPIDLGAHYVNLRGVKRIDPARASSYARTTLVGGELLLCVRGSTGTISIAENELSGANVTRGIVPIRLNGEILLPEVAYYCFLSRSVQQQIAAATYGAALQQINIKDVRKLQIPVPSIGKQGELLGRLSQLSEHCQTLVAGAEEDMTDLNELRQSLLQKAFAGELT